MLRLPKPPHVERAAGTLAANSVIKYAASISKGDNTPILPILYWIRKKFGLSFWRNKSKKKLIGVKSYVFEVT